MPGRCGSDNRLSKSNARYPRAAQRKNTAVEPVCLIGKLFASPDRERRMIGFVRALTAFGSVLGLALAISGVARSKSCPSKCTSGMVPLGVMAPISGPSAAFGQPAAKAIEIAVRSLNAAGGLSEFPSKGWSAMIAATLEWQRRSRSVTLNRIRSILSSARYAPTWRWMPRPFMRRPECTGDSVRAYDNDGRSYTAIPR